MERIVGSREMKDLDAFTIHEKGMPSLVLMERAAMAVKEELEKSFDLDRVLVVCGSGNNGGDGIAAARMLHLAGIRAEIFLAGKKESFTEETGIQWKIAENYGVPVVKNPRVSEYTTIVDAVFGVGLSRRIQGHYGEILERLDASGVPVLAVDIPSGIHGSTGQVMGTALHARQTVTFGFPKTGLLLYPGAEYTGQITVRDVGIYENTQGEDSGKMFRLTEKELGWIPPRVPWGNKGTFGKVLVAAGSRNMCGAAYFAGKASLLAGAGMVRIFTPECNRLILQQLLPEAMLTTYREEESPQQLTRLLEQAEEWADVTVAGPGLGLGESAWTIVRRLLEGRQKPLVLDADGLNALAGHTELLKYLERPLILTPHMGEMCRLSGRSMEELKADPVECLERFASGYPLQCILKDARTITRTENGTFYLNTRGNSGMATAGSGDVLAGIAGGLLALGIPPCKAAPLAVDLHARAGDLAAKRRGFSALTASDLLEGEADVFRLLERTGMTDSR